MPNIIPRLEYFVQAMIGINFCAKCPHCRSDNTVIIRRKFWFIRIRECKDCLIYFTDPIYRRNIYSNLYDGGVVTALPSRADIGRIKADNFKTIDRNYDQQLDAIKRVSRGNRLLEVGSSWGYFLYQASKKSFRSYGIEIDHGRSEYGKDLLGVNIYNSFDDVDTDTKFDAIFSSHTLEHFTDLTNVFSYIYEHLESDGYLFVEVPNVDLPYFGPNILTVMGAVHPLGFLSDFFIKNLPKYGFSDVQFFAEWNDIPGYPQTRSSANNLIVVAKK